MVLTADGVSIRSEVNSEDRAGNPERDEWNALDDEGYNPSDFESSSEGEALEGEFLPSVTEGLTNTERTEGSAQRQRSTQKELSKIPLKERVTTPFLTRYERARVLGTRALQISMNAPILVPLEGEMDPLQIALKELQHGVIPIIIRRNLPNGTWEDWKLSELAVDMERTLDDRYQNLYNWKK